MSQLVFRLLRRHQQVDEALRLEQSRRWPDLMRLQRLKKVKLSIKDRLAALTRPKSIGPRQPA